MRVPINWNAATGLQYVSLKQIQDVVMRRERRGFVLFLLLNSLVLGCGQSGVSQAPISGDVTFAGQPIVFGTIQIIPDKSKGHTGPAANLDIVNGHFEGRGSGKGIVAGPHVLLVTAYGEVPPDPPADESANVVIPPGPEPLFVKYKIEADLKGGVQRFEIPETARGFGLTRR